MRYAYVARNFVITNDGIDYIHAAVAIEKGDATAFKATMRQPLYPAALWAGAKIAEHIVPSFEWTGAQMAQVGRWTGLALYPPFLVAAWFLLCRTAGARLAPWGVLALIVHPLFAYYFANVLSETLYMTFFATGLFCLVSAYENAASGLNAALWWGLSAGLAAALAFLTRVEGQVLLAAGLTCFAWLSATRARSGDSPSARAALLAGAGLLGGMALPALPFVLFIKSTSARYSYEWLWGRLTGGGDTIAGVGLATSPLAAAWMLASALAEHAPIVTILAFCAVASRLRRKSTAGAAPLLAGGRAVMGLTFVWCALAVIAGVTIQNGVVSQRYVQSLALVMVPAALAILARVVGDGPRARRAAYALGSAVLVAAVMNACAKWSHYKTGCRDVGAAIVSTRGAGSRVLTASRRTAFYADSPDHNAGDADVARTLLGGSAGGFDFVVLETKPLADDRLAQYLARLEEQGFDPEPWMDVPEDGRRRRGGNRLLVFVRSTRP